MRPMAAPGQIAMSKDGCPDGSGEVAAPQGLKSQLVGKTSPAALASKLTYRASHTADAW
jgi:hypothetical protein